MSAFELWSPTNKTVYSSVFSVNPGSVVILTAHGLGPERVRVDPTDSKVAQVVCVRKVLYGFDASNNKSALPCGFIFDMGNVSATKLTESIVRTCRDAPWQMSGCRNVGVLGLPGIYRLELNDSTAVGVAQVYAEAVTVADFPPQLSHLFF